MMNHKKDDVVKLLCSEAESMDWFHKAKADMRLDVLDRYRDQNRAKGRAHFAFHLPFFFGPDLDFDLDQANFSFLSVK